MSVYVLNTPILTAYGEFEFKGPVDSKEALTLLKEGFVSAVGHEATAEFLSSLLGLPIPANRIAVAMQSGDKALVMRLKGRLPEGKVLSEAELAAVPYEMGVLTRVR